MFAVTSFAIRLLAAVIAIFLPFLVGRHLNRRHGSPWSLFRTGCYTFVISQVFHIPFNIIVFKWIGLNGAIPEGPTLVYLSLFLGLSAGVFEETTRYLAYRYRLTNVASRTVQAAFMFGAGHGGIESFLLVGLGGIGQLITMTVLQNKDLQTMNLPEDQLELLQKQIHDYWAIPWYGVIMADMERMFTMIIHVAMTLLVLQCFKGSYQQSTSKITMLLLAIAWHAGLDFCAVLLTTTYNMYLAELMVGLWALASCGIIRYYYIQEYCNNDSYEEDIDRLSTRDSPTESDPLTQTSSN